MAKKELQDRLKQLKRKVIVPVAAATLGLSPQAVSAQIPQDDKDKQNPTELQDPISRLPKFSEIKFAKREKMTQDECERHVAEMEKEFAETSDQNQELIEKILSEAKLEDSVSAEIEQLLQQAAIEQMYEGKTPYHLDGKSWPFDRTPLEILKDTTCVEIASENPDENVIRVFLNLGRIVKIYDGDKPLPLTSENIELYTCKLAEMGKSPVHPNHHGFHLSGGTARAEFEQKGAEQTQTEDPYSYASSLKKQKDEKNQRKIKKPLPIVFIKDSGGKDL